MFGMNLKRGERQMTRSKYVVWAAIAAVCAMGIAASSATAKPEKAAATPYKVMAITGIGAPANNFPEFIRGAQAAMPAINKLGGIGGHPLQVDGCNSQFSATVSSQCAHKAVDEGYNNMIEQNNFMSAVDAVTRPAG